MANLNTKTISDGVGDILAVDGGIDASTARQIKDGDGTVSPFYITTTKVGIGASSPGHLLDVATEWTSGQYMVEFTNTQSSNPNGLHINCSGGSGGNSLVCESSTSTGLLVVENGGNVGIGVVNPSYKLDVKDDGTDYVVKIEQDSASSGTASCLLLKQGKSDNQPTSTNFWINAQNNANAKEWAVSGDGSGGTTVYTSSDRRLKENIGDLSDALTLVGNLKPRTFNWKTSSKDKVKYGFIADEYATVFPRDVMGKSDAVNDDGSVDNQMISTNSLYAVLVKAVQELSAKVTALESK
tara:strand:- start:5016 stop:5906 length:891 start_codon:yes stop_codon:yes gene_type:complete